jgi:hypothetical protein
MSRILLPDLHGSTSYYGMELVQDIYTPIDPDQIEVQEGDRPFASYLYVGFFRTQVQPVKRIRLKSNLNIGVIGPAAMGAFVQSTIHEIEPLGWRNQVSNDILVNYNIEAEKTIVEKRVFQWAGLANIRLGTLHTDLSTGTSFRLGNNLHHYNVYSPVETRDKKVTWFIQSDLLTRFVGYDATLQGGLRNQTSPYTIPDEGVQRLVLHASLGFGISYGIVALTLNHHYLTPEFKGGRQHMWSRIAVDFRL